MAGPTTVRLGSNQTGTTGTLVRHVKPEKIFLILKQHNVIGGLFGNDKITSKQGVEIPKRPRIIKTEQIDNYHTECFSNQLNEQSFEVTTAGTAAGTTCSISANTSELLVNSLMQVAETGDVVFVSANSSGALTIERFTGSKAIDVGYHLIDLGQVPGESSTNPNFYLRNDDNHYNYCVEQHTAWTLSYRESKLKRYGGKQQMKDRDLKCVEHLSKMENTMILSKRSSGLTANSATTPRGFESWAQDGSGQTFNFGGTIEGSECRELGDVVAENLHSDRAICLTSSRVVSAFSAALDSKVRYQDSILKKEAGFPNAKAFEMGPVTMEFVACHTYGLAGKGGQGVIIDPANVVVRYLTDLEIHEVGALSDTTQASRLYGEWYSDHCAVVCLDGGKSVTYFHGANALAQ
jgi:hypothetical protein